MAKTHLRLPSSIRGTSRRGVSASSPPPALRMWGQTAKTAFTQLNTMLSTVLSTGLLIALLWLVGRYYAVGYAQAMHIPFFQLTFTVWDHVVQGLTPTWIWTVVGVVLLGGFSAYMVAMWSFYADIVTWLWWQRLLLSLFAGGSGIGIGWWVDGRVPQVSVWLTLLVLTGVIVALPLWLPTAHRIAPMIITILIFVSPLIAVPAVISGIGPKAFQLGWQDAQRFMQKETMRVRLVSSEPTILDTQPSTTLSVNGKDIYTYEGFYLLAFNDGRYFLYKALTSECTPAQVYVVQEAHVQSVQYLPMSPLPCAPSSAAPVTPPSSPLPSP